MLKKPATACADCAIKDGDVITPQIRRMKRGGYVLRCPKCGMSNREVQSSIQRAISAWNLDNAMDADRLTQQAMDYRAMWGYPALPKKEERK